MFHVDNNNITGDNHSEEMDLDQSLFCEEDPDPTSLLCLRSLIMCQVLTLPILES